MCVRLKHATNFNSENLKFNSATGGLGNTTRASPTHCCFDLLGTLSGFYKIAFLETLEPVPKDAAFRLGGKKLGKVVCKGPWVGLLHLKHPKGHRNALKPWSLLKIVEAELSSGISGYSLRPNLPLERV